ncbi:MAG TPA: GntR family transcriptional regulator [Pseudonocardiaceae bacterium]|jgi:DNA-binding GntR family transcriptional regulator|nr:GntR family transcriptional regulator [Pseudonocardiaceae bacterium]
MTGVVPQRQSLAAQTVDVLRELVLTGDIAPGRRVNEVELAQRLGISRGPLREAIRHLISEGLLVYVPHKGTHVPQADVPELYALFELRSALECAAARLAALRRTAADLAAMREVGDDSRHGFAAGQRFPYRLDLAFHGALLDAAASPRIADQVRLVQQQVILLRSTHDVDPVHSVASLGDHDALIDAIAARDPDRAAEVMAAHLDRVRDQMVAARGGTDFEGATHGR